MPFLSVLGSATLFGFGNAYPTQATEGTPQPYNGTMYYYEETEETSSTWATLARWYKNSSHTQSASALPTGSNATVLLNNTSAQVDSWTTPASINLNGKSLTLIGHNITQGCDPAYQLTIDVSGNSQSTLVVQGHITVGAGINHPESVVVNNVTYYYDADIAVEDYIYVGRYTSTKAAAAITFAISRESKWWDVTTNSAGKVTSVTEVVTIPEPETFFGRVGGSKYIGYRFVQTNDDCQYKEAAPLLRLYVPSSEGKPVYLLATRTTSADPWVSEDLDTIYAGDFIEKPASDYILYSTDAYGYIVDDAVCPA